MKIAILVLLALLIGAKAGYVVRGKEFQHLDIYSSFVDVTDSEPFPLKAFVCLNGEMPNLIDQVTGKYDVMNYIVSVAPTGGAGYSVVIAECGGSHGLTESQRTRLTELIGKKMEEYSSLGESK